MEQMWPMSVEANDAVGDIEDMIRESDNIPSSERSTKTSIIPRVRKQKNHLDVLEPVCSDSFIPGKSVVNMLIAKPLSEL